jgi:hypothetical protein
VTAAVDEGRADVSDEEQLWFATQRGLILVTHNERHFKALHAKYLIRHEEHGGIIVIPATSPLDRVVIRLAMLISWIASAGSYQSRLFKWGQLQEALERGSVPPGYGEGDIALALAR